MRRMLRIFLKSLLVLALLFAQQGVVTHGISHVLAEQSHDQSLPHDQHCELCAAYAQVGSALGNSHVHLDFAAPFAEAFGDTDVAFITVSRAAFAARAPPRLA